MAVRTERQLRRNIEAVFKEALGEIATQTRDDLKKNLMTDWYMRSDYKPSEDSYERTYELYDSITAEPVKSRNGGLEVNVFFDLKKINAYENVSGFNAHMSLNGNIGYSDSSGWKPISWWLINWINDGVSPRLDGTYIGNQPIDGIHMFEKTAEWIENNNLDRIIRSVFRKYGIYLSKR